MHADFFAVAATLTPLLLFGAVWGQRPRGGDPSTLFRLWILVTQALPAMGVVVLCLAILGGFLGDTLLWRTFVYVLLCSLTASGLVGTTAQALHREH